MQSLRAVIFKAVQYTLLSDCMYVHACAHSSLSKPQTKHTAHSSLGTWQKQPQQPRHRVALGME